MASTISLGPGAVAEDTPPHYPVPSTPADYRRPMGKLVPAEGALFGAHLPEHDGVAEEAAEVDKLEADIGRKLDINHYYYPFEDEFPTWREDFDFANGRYPLIAWGCHDVDDILSGRMDPIIDARAAGMRDLGKPLFLRWCWEMDGDRPEKSKKVKGPEKFVAAWQYLWKRVYDAGATNVVRVWCPNARGFKHGEAQPFYPGDEWVDWICTDGYNWNPGRRYEDWRSFVEIFDESYQFAVSRYKPLMIGEWGLMERNPGDKAAWIREAQAVVRDQLPAIAAVLVFSVDHIFDWRVTTSPDSYAAYGEWARDPYFNQPDPFFDPGPAENTAPGPLGPPGTPGVGDGDYRDGSSPDPPSPSDQPPTDPPGGDQPGRDQPPADQPAADQPPADQSPADQPGGDQPASNDPAAPDQPPAKRKNKK
jgi:hypothetical protein